MGADKLPLLEKIFWVTLWNEREVRCLAISAFTRTPIGNADLEKKLAPMHLRAPVFKASRGGSWWGGGDTGEVLTTLVFETRGQRVGLGLGPFLALLENQVF